ncbi:MAG: methyl-accepting chemotaxis protein [Nitrospirota bacterium]|nr:methyl-accepting chemotaxis protein [Nitrospirota bacterium]
MFQAWKDRVRGSMALKFAIALSGWIALMMLLGTLFVARMMLTSQERAVEQRGRDIGMVLGKATIDRLAANDLIGLNVLVGDVVKSPDILSIVFFNTAGIPLTSASAGFNRDNPDVKALFDAERTDDMKKLLAAVRRDLSPIEVAVDVTLQGAKMGQVQLALSRKDIRSGTAIVVALLLGTALIIVLSISALLYAMVNKMIALPTKTLEGIATQVSAGDLTQSVRVSSNDEIGYLGRGLNRMIIGIKGMIENVRNAGRKLETASAEVAGVSANVAAASKVQAESVEEAASSVNEMHFSLKEIAGTVEDLNATSEHASSAVIETAASIDEVARTMNDLSTSIEETSSAITQMSAAVRNIAESVEHMSTAADQTAASATEVSASVREVEASARESAALAEAVRVDAKQLGMQSIEKTIDGMRRIEEESRRTSEVINRLGGRAENIGGILTVIEDITDQTSLLALNAAILAAQAGEHGKGFAVVAAEIRELANRTASSTQEIGKLIVSVQEESREAMEAMQKGVELAGEGTNLARAAGDALRKILERADQSRAMSFSISKAAAEQAAGMKQVSEAVDRINEMSHQIARATGEQRSGNEQILRTAEKMREITRFVKSATAEQVKASKSITSAVETVSLKVGMVNRAAGEVRAGSDLIVTAIERIKSTARENAELAMKLNSVVDVMTTQSGDLRKEIERFTTAAAKP